MSACLRVYAYMSADGCKSPEGGSRSPGGRVRGGCEPSDLNTENQTWILLVSSMYS